MTNAKQSRIYVTSDAQGKGEKLVRAIHPAHALRHSFRARIASQTDLERLLVKGQKVEEAAGPEREEAEEPAEDTPAEDSAPSSSAPAYAAA